MSDGNNNGRTYDDPIKALARSKIRDFICANYSDEKQRKLRVLCFPGAEALGEEALEVKQVYDKLGILRRNIVGLEYDRRKAERLQKANLGIEVVCSEDWKYLQDTDKSFDVISLDYTSYFGGMQSYAIDLIAQRRLLGERGVLATNYYGAREDKMRGDDFRIMNDYHESNIGPLDFSDHGERIIKQLFERKSSLSDSRSFAIQLSIISSLYLGRAALDPYRLCMGKSDSTKFVDTVLEDFSKDPEIAKHVYGKNMGETLARTMEFRNTQIGRLIESSFRGFNINGSSPKRSLELAYYFMMWRMNPYFTTKHASYSYVSNKGSPMMMDCFFVDDFNKRIKPDFFKIARDGVILLQPGYEGRKRAERFENAFKFVEGVLPLFSSRAFIERDFLGSSYSPKPKTNGDTREEPEITKEEAIELLASGIPAKEIAEAFSGFSERQLAAFKAHITMGTYKEKDDSSEVIGEPHE